jgi:2-keto-4-pentenoate hydratase/2-oxohepta-3-ene-1,7-dioic acid hydratase in catechol pathway
MFVATYLVGAAMPRLATAVSDLDSIAVAPTNLALTFARVEEKGRTKTLAVVSYERATVTGVDMERALDGASGDAIALFEAHGYEALRRAIEETPSAARVRFTTDRLIMPVDLQAFHVAAGTNFRAHADEAGVEDGPFLFTKAVAPTPARAEVSVHGGLLDYEVELAWVTLAPIAAGQRPEAIGLIACNDFTDRETLIRNIDVRKPTSGKGFTTGKSFAGYLPVGDLFVIAADARAFAADLVLRLYVNGELRQQASQALQVWGLDELLEQAWSRRDVVFEHRGRHVALLPEPGRIPARTLLMAGTPDGTVFRGIGLGHRAAGAARWLFGGWSRTLPEHVIDSYVEAAHAGGEYLSPGDRVDIRVDRLGRLSNPIVP